MEKTKRMVQAARFGATRVFICPHCSSPMQKKLKNDRTTCQNCNKSFLFSRVKYTCSCENCDDMTEGLSIATDGEWESRCEKHLGEITVRVRFKKRNKRYGKVLKSATATEAQLRASMGRKVRVIKKGEF